MAPKAIRQIGILTGGGDCPGLNAVIRAVAKTAQNDHEIKVLGILDSYWGLAFENFRVLKNRDVSGILAQGGTILGTARGNPFEKALKQGKIDSLDQGWDLVKDVMKRHAMDALVAVGGDGTLRVAAEAHAAGIPVVGVPKTIDNDIHGTDATFGFDSAVSIVMEALDTLHSTAMSHHRVMVVEVMGRTVGWLALKGGVAGGGDVLLLPEIPYDEEVVFDRVRSRSRHGKRFSLVVIAEGACPRGGERYTRGETDAQGRKRLGGVGAMLADRIEEGTGLSTRVTELGHLQRGGPPTAFDRLLATQFGHHAVRMIVEGDFGKTVVYRKGAFGTCTLEAATRKRKTVPKNHPLIAAARSVGTCFGDA